MLPFVHARRRRLSTRKTRSACRYGNGGFRGRAGGGESDVRASKMRQVGGGHALAPLEPPQGINRDLGRLSPRLQPLTKERSHHTLELRSRGESRMNTGRGDGDGNEWPRRPAGTGGSPWTRRTGGFGEGTRARGPTMMKTSARRHSTYTPILYNNKTSRAPSCRITHAIDVNAPQDALTSPRPRA